MVLSSLLGHGASQLSDQMKNEEFKADQVLYIGLQDLHDYQDKLLKDMGVKL